MKKTEIAYNKFKDGYNCSQAVSYAFCDELNIDKDIMLQLSCGFGGGMGRKREVCGAVSGGVLVLGMKYGRGENQERSSTDKTYQKTSELMERFQENYGSYICRELLESRKKKRAEELNGSIEKSSSRDFCANCVCKVVEIVEDLMLEDSIKKTG